MKARLLPLLAVLVTGLLLAAPRPAAQVIPSGSVPQGVVAGAAETAPVLRTGAPLSDGATTTAPGAPLPSEKLGDYSSAQNPELTPEPTPKPRLITGGIGGQATWWFSFGHGLYAAIRPDLGTKGDLAIVCGGKPYHCLSLPVITTCACLGPGSDRLIDLSRDAFESFADPSVGTIRITLQVVTGGAP